MRVAEAGEVAAALPFDRLVPALRDAFAQGVTAPLRHQHGVGSPGAEGTLLLMPAWNDRYIGVKIVSVFPGNSASGLPAIQPTYVLSSGTTGEPYGVIEGAELTRRRTAAASALAASYLARPDASRLLVVGAGAIAEVLPAAYGSVLSIERVQVWNRTPERAETLAAKLRADGVAAERAPDLEAAARDADVVSCATISTAPLVAGGWLAPGTHLDLIGSFSRETRETDDDAIRRATCFVDTEAALEESGDLIGPIESGALSAEGVAATLADLTTGAHAGRTSPDEITLFKSVGTALEDLAAAALVFEGAAR